MEHLQFDGVNVEAYDGRFAGAFDIDEHVGTGITYGDEVTFMVTAVASGVSFKDSKDGQLKRVNSFKVVEALAIEDRGVIDTVLDAVIGEGRQSVDQQIPGQLRHFDDEDVEAERRSEAEGLEDSEDEPESDPEDEIFSPPGTEVYSPKPDIAPSSDPVLQSFLEGSAS